MEIEFAIIESSVQPVVWMFQRSSKDAEFEQILLKHIQPESIRGDTDMYRLFETLKGGISTGDEKALFFIQRKSYMLKVKAFLAAYKYAWENQYMKKIEI